MSWGHVPHHCAAPLTMAGAARPQRAFSRLQGPAGGAPWSRRPRGAGRRYVSRPSQRCWAPLPGTPGPGPPRLPGGEGWGSRGMGQGNASVRSKTACQAAPATATPPGPLHQAAPSPAPWLPARAASGPHRCTVRPARPVKGCMAWKPVAGQAASLPGPQPRRGSQQAGPCNRRGSQQAGPQPPRGRQQAGPPNVGPPHLGW